MVARSVVAVCVSAVLAATGCSAAGEEEPDESTRSELKMRSMDDVPSPGPVDAPRWDLSHRFDRPTWDFKRYLEDEGPDRFDLGCSQYDLNVYDPGRGRDVRIPITVCN